MKFNVSALLPIPAAVYFVERDSSAFRSLVAEVITSSESRFNECSALVVCMQPLNLSSRADMQAGVPRDGGQLDGGRHGGVRICDQTRRFQLLPTASEEVPARGRPPLHRCHRKPVPALLLLGYDVSLHFAVTHVWPVIRDITELMFSFQSPIQLDHRNISD